MKGRIAMVKKLIEQKGFSLIEFVVVVSVLAIFLIIIIPGCTDNNRYLAREAEVKANCHSIQVALERYFTDNNEYPHYLLGGDVRGWNNWHSVWDGVNDIEMSMGRVAANDRVKDPLIEYDYIWSYPSNPFVDQGSEIILRTNQDNSASPGGGDPRFGFTGVVMGQGLDDLNLFCGAVLKEGDRIYLSEVETRRTLDHGDWMNVPEAFDEFKDKNRYYLFGGWRINNTDQEYFSYWPGNFFYKGTTSSVICRHGFAFPWPNANQGGWFNRYILGGYGAEGIEGMDIIRLEPIDPNGERVA